MKIPPELLTDEPLPDEDKWRPKSIMLTKDYNPCCEIPLSSVSSGIHPVFSTTYTRRARIDE